MGATRLVRWAVALSLATVGPGCALKSPPTAAELRSDALSHVAVPPAWKGGGNPAPIADQWLATFGDPALTALVAEAMVYNADLRVAAERVEQAAGYVKVAGGSLLPAVGVAARGGDKSGGGGGLEGVWLSASLELDVWGRLRYGAAAAQAQSEAAAADYAYARQSLAALVAKSWFVAIEAGLQGEIARQVLGSSQELLRVAEDRLRIGSGNEQSVVEARANVGSYRDTQRQIEYAREQAVRALELLLGRYPATEIAVAGRLAAMPPAVPVGLPSQLLERRPDVIAAERRVAAAFDRVGEAKAAQLPRISLTAGGSSISSELLVLQDHTNPVWSLGANLIAPLYQGGALRAQVEIRSAEQKQAVAEYARAGLRAFGEVESALGTERALRDRDQILEANVRDNQRALELVQIQFRVGSVDQRVVEGRQLSLYAARISRLRVQTELLAQRVNLHLALGGGFAEPVTGPVALKGTQ
jgi:outer membrane protein, multidrug efflux system